MLAFADVGEMSVQFDPCKNGEYEVDDKRNDAGCIREKTVGIVLHVVNLCWSKEEDRKVGQEEHIAGIVPTITKKSLVDKSLDFRVIFHAFFNFLCSCIELSHKFEHQVNNEHNDT
jgi:hypothetical protein